MKKKQYYKTIFISDIHLGNPKNQSDKLIEFLGTYSFNQLIIVGDFIDFRQLKRFGKRTNKETNMVNYINQLLQNGVKITYIQGNHDRIINNPYNLNLKDIIVTNNLVYKAGNGKTYYVTHGDCLDSINSTNSSIGKIGSFFYGLLLSIESIRNKKAKLPGKKSIAESVEHFIKIRRFSEEKLLNKIKNFMKERSYDGIILGHFHRSFHKYIDGIECFNTGDWLKNLSAVVEDNNGNLKLISPSKKI